MKSVCIATSLCALAASTSVFAANEFEGPWAGLGMGVRGTVSKISDNAGNSIDSLGRDSVFGVLQGGWGFKVDTDFGKLNLGPYIFYYLGNVDSDTRTVGGINAMTRWKNQWGLGLQPGIFVSKDTVVYLKAGFNSVTVEVNASNPSGQISPSDQFSGPAIGLGMKHQLNSDWVIFVDTWEVFYGSKDYTIGSTSITVRPRMVMGQFGFGYQF